MQTSEEYLDLNYLSKVTSDLLVMGTESKEVFESEVAKAR
jgi:hypothetical protein